MAIIPFEDFSTEERKAFEGVCRRHGRNPAEFPVRGESQGGDGQADEIAQRTISVGDEDVTELFDHRALTALLPESLTTYSLEKGAAGKYVMT
jgi:hypothetical protein